MIPYYQDDAVTIYHGDCREILPTLQKVDLVVTDPPYGIGADKNLRANKQHGKACAPSKDYGIGKWDNKTPDKEIFLNIIALSKFQIIWGGNYFSLSPSPCWLVWDKDNGDNNYADCELAWTNLEAAVRKFRYRWMGMLQEQAGEKKEIREHPTQKPVPVMKWAITLAPESKTILDPFMGSGTTLRAAKDLGRKAIGIELEEKYCEIAAKRMMQEVLAL
jgi:DNA modification methylase